MKAEDDAIYDVLWSTLARYGVSDEALKALIFREMKLESFSPEEKLITQGEYPRNFYIIRTGLVRYYYSQSSGKYWNKVFFKENEFCGSLNALLTDGVCRYDVEAVEATQVYSLPLSIMERASDLHVQLTQLKVRLTEEMFLRNEFREALLLTCNAEARYEWVLEHEPWLVPRIPQYHLASYLGMDAVSLSRIKKKLSQRK